MADNASNPSSPSRSEPRIAPFPFNKPITDIILRTSDNVDFYVYSQILIAASPVFEGMFEVPQPPAEQQELTSGRPIVELSEDSGAMETLLRIIYPINKPTQRTVKVVEPALRAAMKFEMELAITVLKQDLTTAARDRPMQVWATACRLELEDMASIAASNVVPIRSGWGRMTRPLAFEELGVMEGISAGDYYRLAEFYRLEGSVPQGYKFLTPQACETVQSLDATQAGRNPPLGFLCPLPDADLLCRASNGVTYPAHRIVLCAASASLAEHVLSHHGVTAEGSATSSTPTPVLQFSEDSNVLAALLRICYHDDVDDLLAGDLPLLLGVLAAMERHHLTGPHARFLSRWRELAEAAPLRAYCVAIGAGHTDCAREAARLVVRTRLEGAYVEEMERTPALSYHRLWTYYRSCERLATERLQNTLHALSSPPQSVPTAAPTVPATPQGPVWGAFMLPAPQTTAQPETTWIRRYVRRVLVSAPAGPHVSFPPLQDLLAEATGHADTERFWCDRCQPLAEDLIKADAQFKELVTAMDAVELQL